MEVQFRTRKLKKQYENSREAEKSFGVDIARKYIQRINIMKHVRDINELRILPALHCHPLKGRKKGHWAIKLTGYHRLLFTLAVERIDVAEIEEVSKHYED